MYGCHSSATNLVNVSPDYLLNPKKRVTPSATFNTYLLTINRSCGLSVSSSFAWSSFTRGSSEFDAQTAY